MIIIWDNGRSYSDHGLYFLDIENLPEDQVVEALKTIHEEGEIIGTVERIDWRDSRATGKLAAFVTPGIFFDAWAESDFTGSYRGEAPKKEDAALITEPDRTHSKMYWFLYPKHLDHLTPTIFKYLLPWWLKAEWIGNWGRQIAVLEDYFRRHAPPPPKPAEECECWEGCNDREGKRPCEHYRLVEGGGPFYNTSEPGKCRCGADGPPWKHRHRCRHD
jgi:hypothetical protein